LRSPFGAEERDVGLSSAQSAYDRFVLWSARYSVSAGSQRALGSGKSDEQQHTSEERGLLNEISSIAGFSVWRLSLRSQVKAKS
jgi:hypothetical protein